MADWFESVFQPTQWQTTVTCRDAVLAEMPAGSYPRLQDSGSLHHRRKNASTSEITTLMMIMVVIGK